MRISFECKNYPLSPKLTQKSQRVGMLTHPLYGVVLGALPGFLLSMLFPAALTAPLVLMAVGFVAGPILLKKYRKKKFAQYDAEYAQLLRSSGR